MATQQGYGQLSLVQDAATRQLLQALFDQVRELQEQLETLRGAAVQRSGGVVIVQGRLAVVADPVQDTDAVNRRTLRREVADQLSAFAAPAP